MMSAMLSSARVKLGNSRWRSPSIERKLTGTPRNSAVGPRPLEGSQPRNTANTMISIRPTQKVGSEKPRIEPAMMVRPAKDSGFRPAYRPSGRPITTAIRIASTASSSVAGMRSKISSMAGTLKAKDLPRLPASACLTNTKYWTHIGLSSPRRSIAPARSAWVASGLIRMSIGLPIA